MTCKHTKTDVIDSRPSGAENRNGNPIGRNILCNYLIRRRRRCKDCGQTFTTLEITKEELDKIVGKRSSKEIIKFQLIKFVESL